MLHWKDQTFGPKSERIRRLEALASGFYAEIIYNQNRDWLCLTVNGEGVFGPFIIDIACPAESGPLEERIGWLKHYAELAAALSQPKFPPENVPAMGPVGVVRTDAGKVRIHIGGYAFEMDKRQARNLAEHLEWAARDQGETLKNMIEAGVEPGKPVESMKGLGP